MSISMPATMRFTAGATEQQMRSAEDALRSSGFESVRRQVHPVPAGVNLPLAAPTLEVVLDATVIANHSSDVARGLAAVRREAPDLGLIVVVEASAGSSLYTWKREASADHLLRGAASIDPSSAPASYGWDAALNEWIRV